jgi:hypothetical protein
MARPTQFRTDGGGGGAGKPRWRPRTEWLYEVQDDEHNDKIATI